MEAHQKRDSMHLEEQYSKTFTSYMYDEIDWQQALINIHQMCHVLAQKIFIDQFFLQINFNLSVFKLLKLNQYLYIYLTTIQIIFLIIIVPYLFTHTNSNCYHEIAYNSVYHWFIMEPETTQSLSGPMVVLSLVNGMIGGLILILPVLALQGGYLSTFFVIGITGLFSYYSAKLCVLHIGNSSDLDMAIYKHFDNSKKMKVFYDLCVWANILLFCMLYFELITIQWIGLAAPHRFTQTNAVLNAILLFVIVIAMKFYDFGANLMAYGVISIASYLVFLGWVVMSQESTGIPAEYKAVGSGAVQMAAAMGQAFAIQTFHIPVLRKNNTPQNYSRYVLIAYVIGGLAYYYIAYMGSLGILYRTSIDYGQAQKTIEDYFGDGAWQVNLIQLIYLVHLYSVSPEFMLISKKRLFGVFNIEQSPKGTINASEIIYLACMIALCMFVTILQISIHDIIDINGAVLGFLFIYFIPSILHLKCTYFRTPLVLDTSNKENNQKYEQMIEQKVQKDEPHNQHQNKQIIQQQNANGMDSGPSSQKKTNEYKCHQIALPDCKGVIDGQRSSSIPNQEFCDSHLQGISNSTKFIDIFLIASMLALGLFILVNGLYELITQ